MARKFLDLVENTITRMSNGSFLTGDLVKLISNFKSKDSYKALPEDQKKYIDDYFDSDKNYYIVNIQTDMPSRAPGNADNRATSFSVTVARELANGRYDNQGKVTLPSDVLERIDTGINRHPVPDSDRYDNKVQIDPKEVGEEDEIEITRMTQQGDSLKKTEISNPTQNTKIPSSPATKSPAVNESYTSQYMPING
mgnify:CR=1 FL=1|jgi:hypothetical protein